MSTLREQLLRSGVGSVIVKLSNILLLFATTTVLARACGAFNFGVYSYVYAIIQILAILAQLGFQILAVREVAAYRSTAQWGVLKGFIRQANVLILVVSALMLGLGLLATGLLAGKTSAATLGTFRWGLALFPLIALGSLRGSILRGFHRVVQGQLPEYILRPGVFLLLVIGAMWVGGGRDLEPQRAMALHAVAGLVAFGVGAIMLSRQLPSELEPAAREYETRRWVRSALLLSLITSLQIVNNQTDIVMLGLMAGPREAGVYRVAVQCSMLVTFGLAVVNMVVAPYFGSCYAQQDMARIQSLATISARVAVAFALPVLVVYVLAGTWILGKVFGPEFAAGWVPLLILSGGQLVGAAMGTVVVLLSMTGHEFSLARGLMITAGLNILLNLVLIPRWGMTGAATATAVSMLFWNVVLARTVKARLNITSWVFAR